MAGREDYDGLPSADAESGQALLPSAAAKARHDAVEVQDTAWWRFFHALGFATGGTTFIAGTACYYVQPQTDYVDAWAAVLYIVGSIGFLSVDVMELFTPAYKVRHSLAGWRARTCLARAMSGVASSTHLPPLTPPPLRRPARCGSTSCSQPSAAPCT